MKIYAATSWRNLHHERIVALLREEHRVYDFRHPSVDGPIGAPEAGFSWAEIDPNWQQWTPKQYHEALKHAVSQRGYGADRGAMEWADACVITLPCGRSAHLEAGWMMGRGKPTAAYLPEVYRVCSYCKGSGVVPGENPRRNTIDVCHACINGREKLWNFEPELMYLLGDSSADHIVTSEDELRAWLKRTAAKVELRHMMTELDPHAARLVDGQIVPGAWIKPFFGTSRYFHREEAERKANFIATLYGPDVWEGKVEEEPSQSDPGKTVFQVYIRSLGAMEGLR